MEIFCTSKNSGPTWSGPDPVTVVYLGTDLEEAKKAVGNFVRYERVDAEFPREEYLNIYSALPRSIRWEMVKYYMADGWWYSIVKFELFPTNNPHAMSWSEPDPEFYPINNYLWRFRQHALLVHGAQTKDYAGDIKAWHTREHPDCRDEPSFK